MPGTPRTPRNPARRSVPLEYGPDALEFDGSPTVLFDRPGLTLVGWGTAQLVAASSRRRGAGAIPCDDRVGTLGSGPVALGALPFVRCARGVSRHPALHHGDVTRRRGRHAALGHRGGPGGHVAPDTDALFDAVIWQYGKPRRRRARCRAEAGAAPNSRQPWTRTPTPPWSATPWRPWAGPGPAAQGRPVPSGRRGPRRAAPTLEGLRRLRAGEPNCTIFSMPVPDGSFFGASPELLVARHGAAGVVLPLGRDRAPGRHRPLRRRRAARARPLGQEPRRTPLRGRRDRRRPFPVLLGAVRPDEPSLVAFRSVAHLGTRIEGALADDTGVLALVERSIPRPPSAARPGPKRSRSSAPTRPAGGTTGRARSAGPGPTGTGNG